jgi:hypothetical protein
VADAALRAGANDRQVDRNHRQHARREIERQAAEEHQEQDGNRAAALEHALVPHAALGVANEGEKVCCAEVAAGAAEHGEVIELGQVGGGVRGPWRRLLGSGRPGRVRFFAATERDAIEQLRRVGIRRNRRGRGNHVERPFHVGGDRCVAQVGVAGLIAQMCGHVDRALRDIRSERQTDPDQELALEHGERLVLPGLCEIDRRRKDDFVPGDAGRDVDAEHGRNQRRVARFVRLRVQSFGERHLQGEADAVPGADRGAFDEGRDFGARAAELCIRSACDRTHREQ